MKKLFFLLLSIATLLGATSCLDDDPNIVTYETLVQLVYPVGIEPHADVPVTLTSTAGTTYLGFTNDMGTASFYLAADNYTIQASDRQAKDGTLFTLNGSTSGVIINSACRLELKMEAARTSQLVIKELYVGGCPKGDGSGNYQVDNYVTIYNNSDQPASVDNLCLGFALPFNSNGNNNNYKDGKLSYESQGFQPAGYGLWYFQQPLTLEPFGEAVVAILGAIDHTQTYAQSVNLANSAYYACYDVEDWDKTDSYPAPYEGIPASHYLLAEKWSQGTAWPLSKICPAFFIFATEGITPTAFAAEKDFFYNGDVQTMPNLCLKVRNEWILDAVEVFTTTSDKNVKRFTSAVDAGAVYFTNKLGYTIHRVVDMKATCAIPGNEAKLVKGLPATADEAKGVVTCDPSGVNAEASAKNGAKIIYQDTNNSSADFFERYQSALRD